MSWQGDVVKLAAGALLGGFDEVSAERASAPGNGGSFGYGNVVLRCEHARVDGLGADESLSELILTDTHLILDIYVDKGMFNRRHRYDYLPLGEVMCDDGAPCVAAVKKFLSGWSLEVEFKYGKRVFDFFPDSDTQRWADAIYAQVDRVREMAIERKRVKQLEENAQLEREKAKVDVALDAESAGNQGHRSSERPKVIVTKCQACRAPLSGPVGKMVSCAYCDMKQTIA